jgi:hypothetical protein
MVADGPAAGVRCDINAYDYAPPPRPPGCELAWGGSLAISTAEGSGFVCAADTAYVSSQVLAYGATLERGPYRCHSDESGITCLDTDTGRGFMLARGSYILF